MLKKKKGNSNSEERMDLLERFEALFRGVKIAYLTGDREFIGQPWLSFLMIDQPIRFRLRIGQTDKISRGKGQLAIAGAHLFRSLAIGEQQAVCW